MVFKYLSLFLYLTTDYVISESNQCSVNVKNGMHKQHPPLVVSLTYPPSYVYPTIQDPANLVFKKGQKVTVICPGKSNHRSTSVTEAGVLLVQDKGLKHSQALESIECLGTDKFRVHDEVVDFKEISCEEKPRSSYSAIMKDVETKCVNGDRYEIGYDLGEGGFLRTIQLCHDKRNANTVWAHGVILPVNQEKYRSTGPAKTFKTGSLYDGMQMAREGPYSLNSAYQNLASILLSTAKADKYLSPKITDRKFLARGHLIANADMLYKSEQDSTYFYANTVPMWQQINANPGNWFFVEEYVRYLAFQKQHELDIWVGGLGTLELENQQVKLYRKTNAQNDAVDTKIPVPKVLYKCVVDKLAKEAICFLVVNNPYLTKGQVENAANKYLVCKKDNRCNRIAKSHNDASLGYLYCCSLKDFYNKNRKETGLKDVKNYLNYKAMTLLTKEKGKTPQEIE